MDEILTDCVRPNCDGKVSVTQAMGTVNLTLERRFESEDYAVVAVSVYGEICAGCSNDLSDWWLYGKKS